MSRVSPQTRPQDGNPLVGPLPKLLADARNPHAEK